MTRFKIQEFGEGGRNLEDLDAGQRAKRAFRIKQAKKHGLKTIAHFGIPRMVNYDPVME